MKNIVFILILIFGGLLANGCTVHKIDIQQGNVITQELLEKLKPGMDKKQVQRLLGTPMIQDPFHKARWDYIYRFVVGSTGETQTGHLKLIFDGDQLTTIDVVKTPPKESEIKTPSLIRE